MFPVPDHLPRSRGQTIPISSVTDTRLEKRPEEEGEAEEGRVLDLLQPLLLEHPQAKTNAAVWSSEEIGRVRKGLEKAIEANKAETHRLLLDNLPSISHHIQLGSALRTDLESIERKVEALESELDVLDPATSFLPPLIEVLNKHFTSLTSLHTSSGYLKAFKALQTRADRVKRLEDAVWSGTTAEGWVVDYVAGKRSSAVKEGGESLEGTRIAGALDRKEERLVSMVLDQMTDGFHQAVQVVLDAQRAILRVNREVVLRKPTATRPTYLSATASPPAYPLHTLLTRLSSLSLLSDLVDTLRSRIHQHITLPLVSSRARISIAQNDEQSELQTVSGETSPDEVVANVEKLLEFVSAEVIPHGTAVPERSAFLTALTTSTLEAVLANVVITSIPASLPAIPPWLDFLQSSLALESFVSPSFSGAESGSTPGRHPLSDFWEKDAGTEYATKRRYATADHVRGLVLREWKSWEARTEVREREVVGLVEVEVESESESDAGRVGIGRAESLVSDDVSGPVDIDGEEDDGWGFNEDRDEKTREVRDDRLAVQDDGWGFDDEPNTSPSTTSGTTAPDAPAVVAQEDKAEAVLSVVQAQPAKPAREAKRLGKRVGKKTKADVIDPWDQPLPSPPHSPVPAPSSTDSSIPSTEDSSVTGSESGRTVPKPAREAKRLGKKVGKKLKAGEFDAWGMDYPEAESSNGHNAVTQPIPAINLSQQKVEEGWELGDEETTPVPAAISRTPPKKRKRKQLVEEKKVIRERFMVSTTCDRLLDVVKQLVQEVESLESSNYPSPSFNIDMTGPILLHAMTEVFSLYRALLPGYYAQQLRDVPALAMQTYNDAIYLSTRVSTLKLPSIAISHSTLLENESARLGDMANHIFERFLDHQRNALDEEVDALGELVGTGDDLVFKRDEKVVEGVVHELESLERVLKPVIAQSTKSDILGHLLTHLAFQMSSAVLSLADITEIESNRLTELLRLVYPLENLFAGDGEGGVVQHVRGWLKFCYLAEILQANLVDITYLLDQGALVDFTTDELVRLIRALFANSEKRDQLVERVEREGTGAMGV